MALVAWACTSPPGVPAPAEGKPGAPVEVRLDARELAGGELELTLTATPSVDVDALELRLGERRESVGRTRAGETRTLRTRVRADGAGAGPGAGADAIYVAGGAVVFVGGARLSRAATVRLGANGANAAYVTPAPTRVITLPGGERVAEQPR